MPKICSVAGCANHHLGQEKLSFLKFPDIVKEPDRRAKWIRDCCRQNADGSEWKPTVRYIYVCSQHFISGKPSSDSDHPDHVPGKFSRTPQSEMKGQRKIERFNSAKRGRLYTEEEVPPGNESQTEETEPEFEYTATPLYLNDSVQNINDDIMTVLLKLKEKLYIVKYIAFRMTPQNEPDKLKQEVSSVHAFNTDIINILISFKTSGYFFLISFSGKSAFFLQNMLDSRLGSLTCSVLFSSTKRCAVSLKLHKPTGFKPDAAS